MSGPLGCRRQTRRRVPGRSRSTLGIGRLTSAVTSAEYAAEHLEHAFALTGHGAQGATVDWAGVIGRPSEFMREWAYTAFSRARERTRVYLVAEPRTSDRDHYAPPETVRTTTDALTILGRALRRREVESLAIEASPAQELPADDGPRRPGLPLAELAEAGPEQSSSTFGHGDRQVS